MLLRSASAVSIGNSIGDFAAGMDSPVRADSSTRSSFVAMRRKSAGILSPASSTVRSPGTNSDDGNVMRSPSRITVAEVRTIATSASRARSARDSCTNPTVALSTTTPRMTQESAMSPSTNVRTAATIRT